MDLRAASQRLTRVLMAVVAVFIGLTLVVQDADARRFGGGKSFGRQSPNATRQAQPPSQDAARQAQPTQPPPSQTGVQPPRNRWLGPLAGLAAGLGIAALLSHFGMMGPMAEMFGSLLLIGLLILAAVVIWRMLRGGARGAPIQRQMMDPVYQAPGGSPALGTNQLYDVGSGARPGSVAALSDPQSAQTPASTAAPTGVPADFDVPGFLRNAKVYFVRLQAAWDARDLADIREFTTPETFAEVKVQIDERKGETDRTEVSDLDAQLLGIETSPEGYLASVRFAGKMRESADGPMEPFEEVWNLWKPQDGRTGWLLAGIQQVH